MEVQIEIAAAGSDMWQAVDTPTPVEDTGFDGPPAQVADAVAFDYADTLAHEDGEPGTQVRATVTRVVDHCELCEATETLAVSDIYVVTVPSKVGRPAVGGTVSTAVGTDRLAAVDAYAARHGIARAEAIRRLVDAGLSRVKGETYEGPLAVEHGDPYWTLSTSGVELLLPADTAGGWGDIREPIEFALLAGNYQLGLLWKTAGEDWAGDEWSRPRLPEPFASSAGLPEAGPDGIQVTIVVVRPGDRAVLATRTVTWEPQFAGAVREAVARQPERGGGNREFWARVTAEADAWDELYPDHESMATAGEAVWTVCGATLFDTDMNPIGVPTREQIEAASTADDGWIWLDPDGDPVNVTDYDEDTVTVNYGPIGNFGKGVGATLPREGYRRVCVA